MELKISMSWFIALCLGIWIGLHLNSCLDSQTELAKVQTEFLKVNTEVHKQYLGQNGK